MLLCSLVDGFDGPRISCDHHALLFSFLLSLFGVFYVQTLF